MKYKKIEGIGRKVSAVICGTDTPPMRFDSDEEAAFAVLDRALALGINAFDTAAAYGESEAVLGRWLASRGISGEVTIITKGANPDENGPRLGRRFLDEDLNRSLSRIGTDCIDIYLLHRDDLTVPVQQVAELLNGYIAAGKIRLYGLSNWSEARVAELSDYCGAHGLQGPSVLSPSFSLADCIGDPWGGSVTISGAENAVRREALAEAQTPVFSYSSLARGFLSGRVLSSDSFDEAKEKIRFGADEYAYPVNFERLARAEKMAAEKGVSVSQIALAWLFHQRLNVFAILGTSSPGHLEENVRALDVEMSEGECGRLYGD